MTHYSCQRFWFHYDTLPPAAQRLTAARFTRMRLERAAEAARPFDGNRFRSLRIGAGYRALGIPVRDGAQWFWVGSRAEYDRLVG